MTANPAEVRLLTLEDTALYRDIRLEALKLDQDAFSSTFEHENAMPLTWFAERIAKSSVFGTFAGGRLLGVTGYRPHDGTTERHKALLWGMYTRKAARGLGLGRRLMEAVVTHATGRVELLQLSVASHNEPAIGLYRKMGFTEYGREIKALKRDERYVDEILMVKFLPRK